MANNPLVGKLGQRAPRGLADFTTGAKGPNDPRSYRASMRAGAPKSAGEGLGVDEDGALAVEAGPSTLLDAALAAGADEVLAAGRTIALGTPMPFVLDRSGATSTISNTTTETTLYSYTVPEYTLVGTRTLRMCIRAQYLNNTGLNRNYTLRVKLGGVTLYDDQLAGIAASATFRLFFLDLTIASLNSSASQMLWGTHKLTDPAGAATTGLGDLATPPTSDTLFGSNGSSSVDMTSARELTVTIQHGAANALLLISRRHAQLEVF